MTPPAKAVPLSYKTAWDALDDMNNVAPEPLVLRSAIVTRASAENMHLVLGRDVLAFVKASSILLLVGEDMRISARNRFTGTITSIHQGPVNAEVTLAMPGGRHVITAVITDDSVKRLGLARGLVATAVFKASSVFLASVE